MHYYGSHSFFRNGQLQQLGMIRKLKITRDDREWELDLATSDKPAAVRRLKGEDETNLLDDELLELLHAIGNQPGSRSLQRTDWDKTMRIANKLIVPSRRPSEKKI